MSASCAQSDFLPFIHTKIAYLHKMYSTITLSVCMLNRTLYSVMYTICNHTIVYQTVTCLYSVLELDVYRRNILLQGFVHRMSLSVCHLEDIRIEITIYHY